MIFSHPFRSHPLFQRLLNLQLPSFDYVVFGSAPLLLWGIRDNVSDLDVLARGRAWKSVQLLGKATTAPSGNGKMVQLFSGSIEFFDRWIDASWNTDELIDRADVVEGIRFANLQAVAKWKFTSMREKDQCDAALMRDYAGRWPQMASGQGYRHSGSC